jgi:formiminoglutamase
MAIYQHSDAAIWRGRVDGDEPDVLRWHQIMHCINLETDTLPVIGSKHQGVAFIGFCSDEGVRRNEGRVGAMQAPRFIREACKNFPLIASHIVLADVGDIVCDDGDLETAQQELGRLVAQVKAANYLPIVLGGGHETAWANFLGIQPDKPKQEMGVINFDAHFDLRQPGEKVFGKCCNGAAKQNIRFITSCWAFSSTAIQSGYLQRPMMRAAVIF